MKVSVISALVLASFAVASSPQRRQENTARLEIEIESDTFTQEEIPLDTAMTAAKNPRIKSAQSLSITEPDNVKCQAYAPDGTAMKTPFDTKTTVDLADDPVAVGTYYCTAGKLPETAAAAKAAGGGAAAPPAAPNAPAAPAAAAAANKANKAAVNKAGTASKAKAGAGNAKVARPATKTNADAGRRAGAGRRTARENRVARVSFYILLLSLFMNLPANSYFLLFLGLQGLDI
jgi:hypothetical protein